MVCEHHIIEMPILGVKEAMSVMLCPTLLYFLPFGWKSPVLHMVKSDEETIRSLCDILVHMWWSYEWALERVGRVVEERRGRGEERMNKGREYTC